MEDKDRVNLLEQALSQMLKRLKGLPFTVVVKALCERQAIAIDRESEEDQQLLTQLNRVINLCGTELRANPIRRPRPNEVGNDIEEYVMRALPRVGFRATRPRAAGGSGKSTGYPDILFYDQHQRPTYLECKTYEEGKPASTMRSFYLSPSESFKVSIDARHLLLAFGMERKRIGNESDFTFIPRSFKLIDLHDLQCDVKYEFNSDNRRLYGPGMILSEGTI